MSLVINLNAEDKMQKNISLFQHQLKKNMIMVKQGYIDSSLLIVIDLRKVNDQTLLITCLEFIIKNANHAWKEKN